MKIQIEDYFGNDDIILVFARKSCNISDSDQKTMIAIADKQGYDLADIDIDEDNNKYFRLQQSNSNNPKDKLLGLIKDLTVEFL